MKTVTQPSTTIKHDYIDKINNADNPVATDPAEAAINPAGTFTLWKTKRD